MIGGIPDKLQAATVFLSGKEVLGIADVELPKVEFDSESLKGFGISGELEVPNPAYIKPMEVKLKFRSVTQKFAELSAPKTSELEILGSVQEVGEDRNVVSKQLRAFMKVMPKSGNPGKLEPSKPLDSEVTLSVLVYKLEFDGQMIYEIDPAAMKCTINGVDYLADTRKNLGLS